MATKLDLAMTEVEMMKSEKQAQAQQEPDAGMKQMERVAKYYETKCHELQGRLYVLNDRDARRYVPLHTSVKRLQEEYRNARVFIKYAPPQPPDLHTWACGH